MVQLHQPGCRRARRRDDLTDVSTRNAHARHDDLPGDPAGRPRPAAACRRDHHHDPRARSDDTALPGHRAADPRCDPHVLRHRSDADVPITTSLRVAGERDVDGKRCRARSCVCPARPWTIPGAHTRGGCSPASRRSRSRPSTSSATAARTCSTRRTSGSSSCSSSSAARGVEPLDFWWAPLEHRNDRGVRRHHRRRTPDHRSPRAPRHGGHVLGHPRRGHRRARGVGSFDGRSLGVRARIRLRLLAGDRHLARGPHLPVLHDHGPEDRARPAAAAGSRSASSSPWPAPCSWRPRRTSSARRSPCSAVWPSSARAARSSTMLAPARAAEVDAAAPDHRVPRVAGPAARERLPGAGRGARDGHRRGRVTGCGASSPRAPPTCWAACPTRSTRRPSPRSPSNRTCSTGTTRSRAPVRARSS